MISRGLGALGPPFKETAGPDGNPETLEGSSPKPCLRAVFRKKLPKPSIDEVGLAIIFYPLRKLPAGRQYQLERKARERAGVVVAVV